MQAGRSKARLSSEKCNAACDLGSDVGDLLDPRVDAGEEFLLNLLLGAAGFFQYFEMMIGVSDYL